MPLRSVERGGKGKEREKRVVEWKELREMVAASGELRCSGG